MSFDYPRRRKSQPRWAALRQSEPVFGGPQL
jgi:hypothetical protein